MSRSLSRDAPGGTSIGIGAAANQIAVTSITQAFVTTNSDGDDKNFPVTVSVGASVPAGDVDLASDGDRKYEWHCRRVAVEFHGCRNPPVVKVTPTITFGAAPTPSFGGGNFIVSATTTNTDSSVLTYSVVSGPCALVSGSTFSSSGAGSCVVQASGAETANFNAASNSQCFFDREGNDTTVVACTAGPFSYNGAAHEPCTATVTGAGGLNQALTVTYADNVNAGTATASCDLARRREPYRQQRLERTSRSTQASSTTTVTCPASR